MNVCEEHKNEREARGPERKERDARRSNRAPQARSNLRAAREASDENVPAKRADFLIKDSYNGFKPSVSCLLFIFVGFVFM